MTFIAFFAAIPHEHFDYLEQTLQEYKSVTQYIIAAETSDDTHQDTSGQHFHFLTDMSLADYHRFSIRVFSKKFKLRGQAQKGQSRQYGKLKEIHDFHRMAAYTCKENNVRTNMKPETIQQYYQLSFIKTKEIDLRQKILTYLDEELPPSHIHEEVNLALEKPPHFLRIKILEYFRQNIKNSIPSKQFIQNLVVHYMLHHSKESYSLEQIDFYINGSRF